jgi:cobalt-zinc-cadmium efflux system protein
MLGLAVLGLLANGVAALRMRGGRSLNERIVTWHFVEDVLGWAAVLVASVIMLFWDLPVLDPALSLLITAYVLWNVVRHLRRVLAILLQAVPGEIRLEEIEERIRAVPGICDVHHTHVWTQDGEHHVLTTHVVPDTTVSLEDAAALRASIRDRLRGLGVQHATIEVEAPGACPCDEHEGVCR